MPFTSSVPAPPAGKPGNGALIGRRRTGAAALAVAAGVLACWPGPWAQGAPAQATGVPPSGRSSLEVKGAARIEFDDASKQWVFQGPRLVVSRGTLRIQAPEIRYAERTAEVTLPRGGAAMTPTLEVRADRLVARLADRHLSAEGHVRGRFSDAEHPSTWGTLTADRVEADDHPERRQFTATGGVVIVREDRRLSGDRVVYDHRTQQGTVDGHAELARGADRLRADHVFADLRRHEATAEGHVLLDQEDMHGSADHATYSEPEQSAALIGHAAIQRGRDTMTADRVTVLLDRHTAIAEGHVEVVATEGGS